MVAPAAAEPDGPPRDSERGSSRGSRRGDPASAAGEWFSAYTEYLRRSSEQSAETIALYQEVTERVVRGDLAPAATQEMLTSFLRARGTSYSAEVGELLMRFFTDVVRINTTFANELGRAILPEAPLRIHIPALSVDNTDPAAWYGQMNDFAQQLGGSIASIYQALIDRAASGDLERGKLEQETQAYVERRLPELLAELGKIYFDLLNGLTDVRIRAEREYLGGVLERTGGPNGSQPFELSLQAPLGETATATLSIENTRAVTARIRCLVSDIRRADGVGPAFAPDVTFGQDGVELAPGEEGRLTIAVLLDKNKFSSGPMYVGTLEIAGHGDPRLEVPLRIEATEPSATTEQ